MRAATGAIEGIESMPSSATERAASQAEHDAEVAAERARVRVIRPLSERDIQAMTSVGEQLWGPGGTFAPNELRAMIHAGASATAVFDQQQPDAPMIGFAIGFLGWSPRVHLHSHQVGVMPEYRRRGVGYALKLAQRQACLELGISDMRWTFDPLIRRNTAFNLGALGVQATSFYPNFYGHMGDAINGDDATDRLEAVWDLLRPLPGRRHGPISQRSKQPSGAPARALLVQHDGWPQVTDEAPAAGAAIAIPTDYETLRSQDRRRSAAWRAATRYVLQRSYAAGLRVGAVEKVGYRLEPNEESN